MATTTDLLGNDRKM